MPEISLALLSTGAAAAVFAIASVMGVITLRVWPYFRTAVAYMVATAIANFLFRGFTFTLRWRGDEFPQPFTTNTALVLQFALAIALFLGISLGYFRARALKQVKIRIMEAIEWVYVISAFVGGGGLVAFFRARNEAPKLAAEAQSIVIRDLGLENTRLNAVIEALRAEIAVLEERINHLETLERKHYPEEPV